jgi:hypothetical protein
MSSAAASLSDFFRLSPRRELVLGAALTAAFAGLVLAVGPAPGDAPVHLYRTFLVRDGALVWDNFWYAGTYPPLRTAPSTTLPAAVVGTRRSSSQPRRLDCPLLFHRAGSGEGRRSGRRACSACSLRRRCSRGSTRAASPRCWRRLAAPVAAVWLAAALAPHGRLQPACLCLSLPTVGSHAARRRQIGSAIWFGVGLARGGDRGGRASSSSPGRAAVSTPSTGSTSPRSSESRRSASSSRGRLAGPGRSFRSTRSGGSGASWCTSCRRRSGTTGHG